MEMATALHKRLLKDVDWANEDGEGEQVVWGKHQHAWEAGQ